MEELKLETVRIGGAGYKCLQVIKGEVDTVYLMNLKTSKWDSCAGQAIILAMGGHSINPYLEKIDYKDTETTCNDKGFLMTTDKDLFSGYAQIMVGYKEKGFF